MHGEGRPAALPPLFQKRLFSALDSGDAHAFEGVLSEVESAQQRTILVNNLLHGGVSLLQNAARAGNPDICRLLIGFGAKPDADDNDLPLVIRSTLFTKTNSGLLTDGSGPLHTVAAALVGAAARRSTVSPERLAATLTVLLERGADPCRMDASGRTVWELLLMHRDALAEDAGGDGTGGADQCLHGLLAALRGRRRGSCPHWAAALRRVVAAAGVCYTAASVKVSPFSSVDWRPVWLMVLPRRQARSRCGLASATGCWQAYASAPPYLELLGWSGDLLSGSQARLLLRLPLEECRVERLDDCLRLLVPAAVGRPHLPGAGGGGGRGPWPAYGAAIEPWAPDCLQVYPLPSGQHQGGNKGKAGTEGSSAPAAGTHAAVGTHRAVCLRPASTAADAAVSPPSDGSVLAARVPSGISSTSATATATAALDRLLEVCAAPEPCRTSGVRDTGRSLCAGHGGLDGLGVNGEVGRRRMEGRKASGSSTCEGRSGSSQMQAGGADGLQGIEVPRCMEGGEMAGARSHEPLMQRTDEVKCSSFAVGSGRGALGVDEPGTARLESASAPAVTRVQVDGLALHSVHDACGSVPTSTCLPDDRNQLAVVLSASLGSSGAVEGEDAGPDVAHSATGAGVGGSAGGSAGQCVVCLAASAVVGFRHGSTVHCCTCRACAQRLPRRRRSAEAAAIACPLCRQDVEEVLLVFTS